MPSDHQLVGSNLTLTNKAFDLKLKKPLEMAKNVVAEVREDSWRFKPLE